MKNTYKQLSSEERDKIAYLRAKGKSVSDIAELLKRNKGTISRELQRNKSPTYNVYLAKLSAKTSTCFKSALNRRLSRYPEHLRLSITYDNGCENVEHEYTNRVLGTRSYFCEPFHSWEMASLENASGIVRRFFPKKTDFALVTKKQVRRAENLINTRPCKCLNYKTPNEFFDSSVALRG